MSVHQGMDLNDRVPEQPKFSLSKALKAKPGGMALRFAAGAMTSVVSGLITLAFGAHIGGIPLAFPAILVASLTLIEEQEDSEEAREDARGAMAGGVALTIFALVAAVLFGNLPGALTLGLAAVAWLITALGLYRLLWWSRG